MEDKRSQQISDVKLPELPIEKPPTAEEKAAKRTVDRILRRVGYSDEDWCKWLLNFAHASFDELGDRDKASLCREVPVFLFGEMTKQGPRTSLLGALRIGCLKKFPKASFHRWRSLKRT